MTIIQATAISVQTLAIDTHRDKPHGTGDFQALLARFDTDSRVTANASPHPLEDLATVLLDNIAEMLNSAFIAKKPENIAEVYPGGFGFTSEFESTFGTSGPLINYINELTERLHLTKEQNLALQQISIDNKDIVKTPASVAKIARELEQAGIGVA